MDDSDPHYTNLSANLLQNITSQFNINITLEDYYYKFSRNRRVDDGAFYGLIFIYSILIIFGATGNILVVCAVARKPAMRTARNTFIVNLAISDLLLCLITMPLTLMEILAKFWPLGEQAFICKMIGTLQATSIFVSTISITAIALDRYQVIVYPTKESLQKLGAVMILSCIWLVSFILAVPLYIWKVLKHHPINLPEVASVDYCVEDWPLVHGRAYYSLFSIIFQYALPILTVSIAYIRICRKLKYRYINTAASKGSQRKKEKDDRRMRKTNSLLISIALIFCISWLPLNLYNLIVDFYNPFGDDEQTMMIIYAICHMMGMSSACSNPLLYGWLNDNFRKEFKEILANACPCIHIETVQERVNSIRTSMSRKRCSKKEPPNVAYRKACETTTNGTGIQQDSEMTLITSVASNNPHP